MLTDTTAYECLSKADNAKLGDYETLISRHLNNGGRKNRGALVPARPAFVAKRTNTPLPQVHLSNTGGIYQSDGAHGSRFKWFISTCIAAAVGLTAIGLALYASKDMENGDGFLASMESATRQALNAPAPRMRMIADDDLRASLKKTDRIELTSHGLSTRHIIQDTIVQKRAGREFISIKPYARIVATLATAQEDDGEEIPPFNPFKLYSNPAPIGSGDGDAGNHTNAGITSHVVELTGGVLPQEDGQVLTVKEINRIVASAAELYQDQQQDIRPGILPSQGNAPSTDTPLLRNVALTPQQDLGQLNNTTVIEKSTAIEEALESHEVKDVKIRAGDTIVAILGDIGAEKWQIRSIVDAMKNVYPADSIQKGQTARFTLVPAPSGDGRMEPIALSLFSGSEHQITVYRNDGGQYVASKNPLDLAVAGPTRPSTKFQRSTIYSSLYHAALAQNIPQEKIVSLLRIHSYHVDFKRRVQPGDSFEAFYDLPEGSVAEDESPGELLYTSTSIGGDIRKFYRFRTTDGAIDYYDEDGSSAKKFLMRKPVRGARYTSGFGYRIHPLLGTRKMHTGTDWAAPRGTPILASGDGVVEAAGRKGGYGNYVRIRHANGYKTAYGHMYRIAKGIHPGVKVRQGQVIGRVGSTGVSSGPHCHFEVLVNNRHVDPMKIEVPSGRDLKGKALAKFQKEKLRIDELMSRTPVMTRVAPMTRSASAETSIEAKTTPLNYSSEEILSLVRKNNLKSN